jgi:sugar/nucleoside kinase (ribokinase family)
VTPSLVLLGNLLVDDIVFPDGSTRMGQPGGALVYGSLGAAIWGTRVGCVSLVGTDYPVTMLDALETRRVDLTGVHRLGGPGVRTWLLYEGHLRRLIHRLGCPTHEHVSPGPEHIPRAWQSAPAFHLAPMPFSVQRRVLGSLAVNANRFVSIDPHLPITEETLDDWRQALTDADAFFPSEDELLLEETKVDPQRVLPRLATGRLRFIVFKQAAKGGISVRRPRRPLPSMAWPSDEGHRPHRRRRCLCGGLCLRAPRGSSRCGLPRPSRRQCKLRH